MGSEYFLVGCRKTFEGIHMKFLELVPKNSWVLLLLETIS